jgi:hypothetical protein
LPRRADLPAPEALSAAARKDAAPLAEAVGEYVAACLASRNWQLREAALQVRPASQRDRAGRWATKAAAAPTFPDTLPSPDPPPPPNKPRTLQRVASELRGERLPAQQHGGSVAGDALRPLCRALCTALRDKVAAVYASAIAAAAALLSGSALSPGDARQAVGELLPVLVERAADLNARASQLAIELAAEWAGGARARELAEAAPAVLRTIKPGAAPKAVLGRCAARAFLGLLLLVPWVPPSLLPHPRVPCAAAGCAALRGAALG